MESRTHYEVLNLDPWADDREIRKAYRRLARSAHPDGHPGLAGRALEAAEEQISILNKARRVLSDPGLRSDYDRTLGVDSLRDQTVRRWTPPPVPPGFVLYPAPGYLAQVGGESFARFADARFRALSRVALTPDFARLADLAPDGVWKLRAGYARITDDQLVHISVLRGLRVLDLGSTLVTDAGMQHLIGLKELNELDLWGTPLTDVGVATIGALTSIENLNLAEMQVSDLGLIHLEKLTMLDTLILRGTKVRGPGLVHLFGLQDLDYVDLPWRVTPKWRRLLKKAIPHITLV